MNTFDKVSLGIYPTPLYRLPNMSRELGTNVWIKRDDMCGVALGGNKVRKLQYLLADAKKQGYDLVMTTGAAQSNHAMLTAACALRLGMDCVLVLMDSGVKERKGNQILNYLMGVRVVYVDSHDPADIYKEMDRIAAEMGRKVYKIPAGGSNALGSQGYVDCFKEISDSGIHFDDVVFACGSAGTASGMVVGASVYAPDTHITCALVGDGPFRKTLPRPRQGNGRSARSGCPARRTRIHGLLCSGLLHSLEGRQ